MSNVAELVGGPLCGERKVLYDGAHEYRVMGIPRNYSCFTPPPLDAPLHETMLQGSYVRRAGRTTLFDWQGWS